MTIPKPRSRTLAGATCAALAMAVLLLGRPAAALPAAMTKEGVQKKAVIITHDARLFARPTGSEGKKADFMTLFFLLTGETGGRVPVTYGPDKEAPDGWLARDSFVEWNTRQMINFEPQAGRELARIFKDAGCAEKFSQSGGAAASPCLELGSEPKRTGTQRDNYSLLVPVLERDRDNYRGGFVRVAEGGSAVKPLPDGAAGAPKTPGSDRVGYDLVLVVDSTASMEQWFQPTLQALNEFIRSARQQFGSRETLPPFRVGLLFYRDRRIQKDCDLEYLFRWEAELTDDISAVSRALAGAKETSCESEEAAESVYDALSRAVQDPRWGDGHYKVVLLVGDAPPHGPGNREKNPLGLDVDAITKMSEERNVRFMTFKIGLADTTEFKELATSVKAAVQGRFRAIEPTDKVAYKAALLKALQEEWGLLIASNKVVDRGITQPQAQQNPSILQRVQPDLSRYDVPIIIANLPPGSTSSGAPEFVEGWVAKKIKQQLAVSEYVFMGKAPLVRLVNVIETIALSAQESISEGGESFIRSMRSSLASMLSVQPEELFRPGESLDGMMAKANVLPFKTTVLSFTAEEVNAWKPADFLRLNKILGEKTTALREFAQRPGNIRYFGDKPHLYVPRDLFP